MSEAELRYWIDQFLHNPELGWSHCKLCFARYLGIDLPGLRSKVRLGRTQAWFCGGEQRRFSVRIRRALGGVVIPCRVRTLRGQWKWEAMMTDDPKPVRQPGRWRPNLTTRRLEFVPPTAPDFTPRLSSFAKAVERFLSAEGSRGEPEFARKAGI